MTMWNDPLERDPSMRPWIEEEYIRWRTGLSDKKGYPADFDRAWAKLDTKAQLAFYMAAQRKRQTDEAQMAASEAGIGTGAEWEKVKVWKTDDKGKRYQEEEWRQKPFTVPPAQIKAEAARAKAAEAAAAEQLKNIEWQAAHREQYETMAESKQKLDQAALDQAIKNLQRAETAKKLEPVKKLLIEPVAEAFVGGMEGMRRTRFGKGSMGMAREAFVPSTQPSHALRPAPRGQLFTPSVARVPQRMPVIYGSSGKMIPAGAAVTAKAEFARKAITQPTVAGSLLETSVSKSPAAQSLIPSRPTRMNLSGLRREISTSRISRGDPLPRLKIKKNLYNEQLRKIRGMLR